MHTNITNEIEKYTAKHLLADIIIYIVMVVFGLTLVLAQADLIFGAEEMAEMQGEVIRQVIK